MSTDRATTYIPLSQLKPDPRNPKGHDLGLIDSSMNRHGVIDNITRDDRTGYIISGHGRAETLKDRFAKGEPAPDGIKTDPTTGEWLVPVTTGWSSKDDLEATAALITLNRATEAGGWVDDALLDALDRLGEAGDDAFIGVGFDTSDLDDLRVSLEQTGSFDNNTAIAQVAAAAATGDPDEQPEGAGDGISGGAGANPSAPGNSDLYAEQGRRLVVLDYSVEEFAEVVPRIKLLRTRYGVDNNAEAMRLYLLEQFSVEDLVAAGAPVEVVPTDSTDYAEVEVSQSTKGEEPAA